MWCTVGNNINTCLKACTPEIESVRLPANYLMQSSATYPIPSSRKKVTLALVQYIKHALLTRLDKPR